MISGWGRFPRISTDRFIETRSLDETRSAVMAEPSLIARGNGRSYGDATLNQRAILSTLRANRLISFDPVEGLLNCEAGLLLADLIELFIPRGWFVPVTPGTKFVTVGGMIASDVHGKNHHKDGSFCAHVDRLTLILASGEIRECSPSQHSQLFWATCGGMGLTGVIGSAVIRLKRIETSFIRQETYRAADLRAVMEMFEETAHWTYSVAWIDASSAGRSLGRALLYVGEHASLAEANKASPLRVERKAAVRFPFDFPELTLNKWSIKAFNSLYYAAGRVGSAIVDYDKFFYPLDSLTDWNRIYGARGFVQFQCVLPKAASESGLRLILSRAAEFGRSSFLGVLKLFGKQQGVMSFPMEGYTLAMDFPADATTFNLLVALDEIVADHGGRLYLTKDSRMTPAMLRRGYGNIADFEAMRSSVDPTRKFNSLQSQRLGL